MKISLPDKDRIREYLLGRLDVQVDQEDKLSEEIFHNDDLSEVMEAVEDEIIEEYLDGVLNVADKKAVDEYFLRPPQRKEKLRFAQLLRRHFSDRERNSLLHDEELEGVLAHELGHVGNRELPAISNVVHSRINVQSDARRYRFLLYSQFAALILLGILSLAYISNLRKKETNLEAELSREREHSASLASEVQLLRPAIATLTLVSDLSRDNNAQIPRVEIKPSAQRIVVEIALQNSTSVPYDIRLETKAKEPIWSTRLLPIVSASSGARLFFDVPTQGITSDRYSFVVSSPLSGTGGSRTYDFQAIVVQ
jgi:hypothetical protein